MDIRHETVRSHRRRIDLGEYQIELQALLIGGQPYLHTRSLQIERNSAREVRQHCLPAPG